MGKIRVATLGDKTSEQEQKNKRSRQREEKKKREKIHVPGMKGGERVVTMTADEEIDKLAKIAENQEKIEKEMAAGTVAKEGKKARVVKKKEHSKNYRRAILKIDQKKTYTIDEALKLIKEMAFTKFDQSVEVHINTIEKGIRGSVALPHGTGKKLRIVVVTPTHPSTSLGASDSITVGGEELIEKISSGWTDFDILIAHPSMMPKLAKFARVLGPKGLMPNPKAGTISDKPEEIAKKLVGGQVQYKSESDFPIIHLVIGKVSFEENKLIENFKALITAINPSKIKNITLKSTMSPGIKVSVS